MNSWAQRFNDWAVIAFSHPMVVVMWWVASLGSILLFMSHRDEVSGTLALSFLALAYSSAIAERQLRFEDEDKKRDVALHEKIDTLIKGVPDADDKLIGSEK